MSQEESQFHQLLVNALNNDVICVHLAKFCDLEVVV